MTLPDLSLRRPVFAMVLNLLIVLIGAVAMSRLPVRELPQVDTAQVTVRVEYTGASPEVVDSQIATVVEGALAGIAGLTSMETRSDRGRMRTVLNFDPSRDIDSAANDVRGAVERIIGRLPDDADTPRVEKNDDEGDPVLRLALSSTEMSPLELSDYARRHLVDRLARLPGVAAAALFGERAPAMRIWLDQSRMAAHGVTTGDVISALQANNIELPAGEIETGTRRLQVLAQTRFTTAQEFAQMVVRQTDERPLRLGDVARIEQGPERDESYYRSNGMVALGIGVQPQAQANTVAISDAVLAELERIGPTLPEGMSVRITSNEAVFIESSIRQVSIVFFEAVALVTLVIFLFLGSIRLSLVPLVTIPISVLGAMLAMMMLGFSINILTLFALILAIGLVVDDAIIVLENIQRHKSLGASTAQAVREGTNQVNFAVIATTIVLVSVFLPVSFMEGEIGRLFAEFGIVLAVAVAVSSFVALSLTPVMAAKLLPERDRVNMLTRLMDRLIGWLERFYRGALTRMIARPVIILSVTSFAVMASVTLYNHLPQELTPQEDRGQLRIFASGPQGVDLSHTDSVARRIEAMLEPLVQDGTVTNVTSIVGMWGNLRNSLHLVTLADWDQRSTSANQIIAQLRPQLDQIRESTVRIGPAGGLGISGAQGSIRWMLGGPDIERAAQWAQDLTDLLEGSAGLGEVEIGYSANQPGADLIVDRARAQDLGLDPQTVGQTLQVLFASRNIGEYLHDGRQYPVVLQAEAHNRATVQDMLSVQLRNDRGDLIPLSAFASINAGATVPDISRYDRMHSVQMEADLLEGTDLAAAIATVESAARQLPAGAVIAWSGQARDYINSSSGVATVFAMSLAIVFLVLAAQFESFRTPLTIMLTVPLGLAGAVLTLFLAGASVNIFSQVGLILLVGIMSKNGILIIEFANQLRAAGKPLVEAAIEGAVTRMRPVMMTTIAMVLGAVPLATATGAGAESRRAIGMVITGGLSFAFVLTLCVTPVIYVLIERLRMRPPAESPQTDEAEASRAARIGAE